MIASLPCTPGIVVGLKVEADIVLDAARRTHRESLVRCAYRDPGQVAALVDSGVPALISFGFAGGLDPGLRSGTLILASSIVLPNGSSLKTNFAWREHVRKRLSPILTPIVAPIAGSADLVSDPAEKAVLWRRTTAAAVDMESHVVAQAAQDAALPFLAIRAVVDPASRSLPPVVRRGAQRGEGLHIMAVLGRTIVAPSQIADLFRLARQARTGMASLRRTIEVLGVRFGLDEMSAA